MAIQAPHPAAIQRLHQPTVATRDARAASARAALIAGVCGLLGDVSYVVVAAMPTDHAAAPFVASLVGPLIAAASVAIYLILAAERPTISGQLAAVANVASLLGRVPRGRHDPLQLRDARRPAVRPPVRAAGDRLGGGALRAQPRLVPDAAGRCRKRGSRSVRRPVVRRGVGAGTAPSARERTPRRQHIRRCEPTKETWIEASKEPCHVSPTRHRELES